MVGYLETHPCVDCGNRDVRVLEFDHRDASTKGRDVAVLVGEGYALDRVKAEVAKCDVRCANCHRIRTHSQRGWWGRDPDLSGSVAGSDVARDSDDDR